MHANNGSVYLNHVPVSFRISVFVRPLHIAFSSSWVCVWVYGVYLTKLSAFQKPKSIGFYYIVGYCCCKPLPVAHYVLLLILLLLQFVHIMDRNKQIGVRSILRCKIQCVYWVFGQAHSLNIFNAYTCINTNTHTSSRIHAFRKQPMDFKLIIPLDFRLHFDHNFLINYWLTEIIIFRCCFNTLRLFYIFSTELFHITRIPIIFPSIVYVTRETLSVFPNFGNSFECTEFRAPIKSLLENSWKTVFLWLLSHYDDYPECHFTCHRTTCELRLILLLSL